MPKVLCKCCCQETSQICSFLWTLPQMYLEIQMVYTLITAHYRFWVSPKTLFLLIRWCNLGDCSFHLNVWEEDCYFWRWLNIFPLLQFPSLSVSSNIGLPVPSTSSDIVCGLPTLQSFTWTMSYHCSQCTVPVCTMCNGKKHFEVWEWTWMAIVFSPCLLLPLLTHDQCFFFIFACVGYPSSR